MACFLHLADIHLGYSKYNSPKRSTDFFYALEDVLQRYAIEDPVDFVVMAGDLFEHRQILPHVLNQAQFCLEMLRDAGIPAITIEGNHDHRPYGSRTSWLRYLAEQDWLILLEPDDGQAAPDIFRPWDPDTKEGGYIDLACGVRVVGSNWYGSAAPQAIQALAAGLQELPPAPGPTVMLFHHGLEGEIARYTGALRESELAPLREAGVNYLAMGHIHKSYTKAGWIFNPGSLEANSVAENDHDRGVYRVTLSGEDITADLKTDYCQRPIVRLVAAVAKTWSQDQVEAAALALIQAQGPKTQDAIVELRIQGQVGFNRLDLNVRQLKEQLHQASGALIFLLKYEVTGTEYQSPIPQGTAPNREQIEAIVFGDLLAAHHLYGDRAAPLAQGLITLKDQILADRPDADLYQYVQQLLESNGEVVERPT
ncbi:metallophosphoesterase family protein [Prochlorothrix hollandica]|uniref:Nuclease SbcCD subunit D n=2 Tax=Prochlorothrix hollandica TaxID=1223 RepID=A0A0M2Q2K6_PROHO|nr:DNA repair exonuclease [Prochlorothrix hollandica]KKJ01209.1 DNA repair protein [Prochlorothrix hollandica PCC 9006 = CALU 1027]